ncbi:hypothetical protein tb265_27150 [Gemmatimonadetes bacterium T265]|nr:hypothetical protein tb265_27150 [Gemmatimonadetes bacterium T265]
MRHLTSSATLLCALGLAAGSAVAQNTPAPAPTAPGAAITFPSVTVVPAEAPEKMFTDAKVAATASVSNTNEIDPSQLALAKSTNSVVRDYAQQMVDEHVRFERSLREMLNKKKMPIEDNALSFQLRRNAGPTLDSLRAKSGAEFDKAYVLQQIDSHDMTLKTLDTSLIPLAHDADLKTMLRDTVRPAVVQHLQRIKQIHDQLAAAPRAS